MKTLTIIIIAFFFFGLLRALYLYADEYDKFQKSRYKLKVFEYLFFYNKRKVSSFAKNNIFFDIKIIFPWLIILILLAIIFKPNFNFPSLETQIFLVDKLLRTSSVFIGIIISLIILSFQLFNKNFGRYAFIGFFKNMYLRALFTLYIINILSCLFTLWHLKEINISDNYSDILFISSIIFTSILIISILPLSVQMIIKSQSRFNIEKIINLITEEWIYTHEYNEMNNKNNLKIIERNPIDMLKEVASIALSNEDNITLKLIMTNLFSHFQKLIKEHNYKNTSINKYFESKVIKLINNIATKAIKQENSYMLNEAIYKRNEINEFIIKNQLKLSEWDKKWEYNGWNIYYDYEDLFIKSLQSNQYNLSKDLISGYYQYCKYIITNHFPNRFIEYKFKNYKDYSAEKHLSSDLFIRMINLFVAKVILYEKFDLFKNIFNLYSLEAVIIDSKNSKTVKNFLLHLLKISKEDAFEKYLNNQSKNIGYFYYPSSIFILQEIEKLESSYLLMAFLKTTKLSLLKSKLNNRMMNDLKATGMSLTQNWGKNPIIKKLFNLIIYQFDVLRNMISENSNTNYQKATYINLNRFLSYIESDYKFHKIEDEETLQNLETVISKFNKVENYQKHLDKVGYIVNENLI